MIFLSNPEWIWDRSFPWGINLLLQNLLNRKVIWTLEAPMLQLRLIDDLDAISLESTSRGSLAFALEGAQKFNQTVQP